MDMASHCERMVENLSRRDLFKLFEGRRPREESLRLTEAIEGGFFQTLYECDGCAKAMEARLAQKKEQCPIHG